MYKILFIIDRLGAGQEILSGKIESAVEKESPAKGETLVLSWDNGIVDALAKNGFAARTPEYYSGSYREVTGHLSEGAGLLEGILLDKRNDNILQKCINLAFPYLNFFYSYRVIVNLQIARSVIAAEKPEKIIAVRGADSFLTGAFRHAAVESGIGAREMRFLSSVPAGLLKHIQPCFYTAKNLAVNVYYFISSLFSQKTKRAAGKKNVLFITPSEAQFETFGNIIKALDAGADIQSTVLCTSEKGYKKIRIPPHLNKARYGEYAGIREIIKSMAALPLVFLQWNRIKKEKCGEKNSGYFFEMISPELPCDFLRYLFAWNVGTNAVNRLRPDLIIVTEDPNPKMRGIQHEAKKRGIPVICVPYGVPVGYKYEMYYDLADYFMVSGELMKKSIEACGVPQNKIKIAAVSRFKTEKTDEVSNRILRRKYNIAEDKKIVLVTSNAYYDYEPGFEGPWTINEYKKWLEAVYGISRISGDVQLIIKPHHSPRDPLWLHKEFNGNGGAKIVTGRESTPELISICDLLITWLSTTAIEAILKGKPVISFNVTGRDWKLPFVKYGAALAVNDIEALNPAINEILKNGPAAEKLAAGRKEYIEGFFGAAGRDVNEIKSAIAECMADRKNV